MSTKQVILPILIVLALIGVLAAGAVAWLAEDTPPVIDPEREETPAAGVDAPRVTQVDRREHTQQRFDLPWPFAEFAEDISELRRPRRRDVFVERNRVEEELGRNLSAHTVTLHLENVTPEDVIDELTRQFAPHGLNVYRLEPDVDNAHVFERFYLTDASVWDAIEIMRQRTNDLVTFAITPVGLCVGSPTACREARAKATEWEEEQAGSGDPDDEFAFLDGNYRPDFAEAHIGAVVTDVRKQNGAEIVIGPEIWRTPIKLSWTADPMPVLPALRQIALKCGGVLYAKDGRVFLLDR